MDDADDHNTIARRLAIKHRILVQTSTADPHNMPDALCPAQYRPRQSKPKQQELLKRDSLIHNGPHPARSVVSKEPPNTAIDITERFLSKKGFCDARWDYATTNKCTFFFPKRVMK